MWPGCGGRRAATWSLLSGGGGGASGPVLIGQPGSANLLRLQNQVTLYRVLGGGWIEPGQQTAAR